MSDQQPRPWFCISDDPTCRPDAAGQRQVDEDEHSACGYAIFALPGAEPHDTYEDRITDPLHLAMRRASGRINDERMLVTFFYLLVRDHLPVGVIEGVVREAVASGGSDLFTNGWVAQYAQHCADRLGVTV